MLLEQHIDRIVDAYQFRKEEWYSRRVPMEEIARNDFNLTISRYVSTTTSDEIIDLKTVHNELVTIEKKAAEAADKHNQFLKELGLAPI